MRECEPDATDEGIALANWVGEPPIKSDFRDEPDGEKKCWRHWAKEMQVCAFCFLKVVRLAFSVGAGGCER